VIDWVTSQRRGWPVDHQVQGGLGIHLWARFGGWIILFNPDTHQREHDDQYGKHGQDRRRQNPFEWLLLSFILGRDYRPGAGLGFALSETVFPGRVAARNRRVFLFHLVNDRITRGTLERIVTGFVYCS